MAFSTFGKSALVTQLRSMKQLSDFGRIPDAALAAAGGAKSGCSRCTTAPTTSIALPTSVGVARAGSCASRKIRSEKIVFVQNPSGRMPGEKLYGPWTSPLSPYTYTRLPAGRRAWRM